MSSLRLIGAICVSLALVGGALWFRFVKIPPYSSGSIVSIQEPAEFITDDAYLKDFLSAATSTRKMSNATLTQEDLLGREIFTEYLSLKSTKPLSSSDIVSLADKYAAEIIDFDITVKKATQSQVVVVPDSAESMSVYGASITDIRLKYKNIVATQYAGVNITDISSPAFSSFMTAASKLYQAAANEFLLVPAPLSLSTNHLDLVNNYLENVEALKLVGNNSKNPAQAYAALNTFVQNGEKELVLLKNIQKVLTANGIIFNSNI